MFDNLEVIVILMNRIQVTHLHWLLFERERERDRERERERESLKERERESVKRFIQFVFRNRVLRNILLSIMQTAMK